MAQLGAVLGREFAYGVGSGEPKSEPALSEALEQLVGAGLLFRRGQLPEAACFKHALVQDAAYASLLKSTRQQLHRQIATVLEACFPAMAETEPEVVAQHYTEAGLPTQAIPYWQRAGQRALQRSANLEAISHVTRGLEVLSSLPETRERAQQGWPCRSCWGRRWGPPRALRRRSAPMPGPVNWRGRWGAHRSCSRRCGGSGMPIWRGDSCRGRGSWRKSSWSWPGSGKTPCSWRQGTGCGRIPRGGRASWSRPRPTAGKAWPSTIRCSTASAVIYGQGSGVNCGFLEALTLWVLGYPDQALRGMEETLALARRLAHPFSLAQALHFSALLHQLRREPQAARAQAEAALALCTEQGFGLYGIWSLLPRGWAIAEQGEVTEGIAQIRQGFAGWRAMGMGAMRPLWVALLAEACGKVGQLDEGLRALEEALAAVQQRGGPLRGRGIPAQGRAAAGAGRQRANCGGSGGVLPASPRRRPPPAGQVLGGTGSAEPEPAVAVPGQVH